MKNVIWDTNVYIRWGYGALHTRLLSAVVLQELTAGAQDSAEVRQWAAIGRRLAGEGRLLVPNGEDWFYVGKVLNSLRRGLSSVRGPRSQAIDKGEQQRLVRNVLIARSAKRVNAAVATYNRADFEKISRFCNCAWQTRRPSSNRMGTMRASPVAGFCDLAHLNPDAPRLHTCSTLLRIVEPSENEGVPTYLAADRIAEQRISAVGTSQQARV